MRCASLLLSLALFVAASGCRGDDAPAPAPAPTPSDDGADADEPAPEEPEPSIYPRTLADQLDLVPPNADAYVVIRDLRPLMHEAHRVERVMAGPLARAIPALAKLGGGTGEARLRELARARELLALILAGLDNAGADPSQGMVLTLGEGEPLVMFAAKDLARLSTLAKAVDVDVGERCRTLGDEGWTVCALGEVSALEAYAPANQGEALAARFGSRLPGVDLGHVNVALSSAADERPIDLALLTDPQLWELIAPASVLDPDTLFTHGPATALDPLAPGTSFMWARVDPSLLDELGTGAGLGGGLLTGELCLGAVDDPHGLLVRAGVQDPDAARETLETLARALPAETIEPAPGLGLKLALDRATLQLDGEPVQTIGATIQGETAAALSASLGLDLRARVWAHRAHLDAALGEVQAIPGALAKTSSAGPSRALLAGLPPTLAQRLSSDALGLVLHLALDPLQAPIDAAELEALVESLAATSQLDPKSVDVETVATAVRAVFESLAPWSSVSLWLARGEGEVWLAHLSIVPFVAATDLQEAEAAATVLDGVLATGGSEAGYRELLARYPRSARVSSYRARAGEAPRHHAAIAMIELAVLGSLVLGDDEPDTPPEEIEAP